MAERSPEISNGAPDGSPPDGVGTLTTLSVVVLAGGMSFLLVGGRIGHTMGASRSMQLEFQERKELRIQEIERFHANLKSGEACPDETGERQE